MQVIENWADIQGTIVGIQEHPTLDGYDSVRVKVSEVKPVAGFANHFQNAAGTEVTINVPHDVVNSKMMRADVEIGGRIRNAGTDRVFLNPDQLEVH